nr:DNA ligase 3 isoform X1 [Hydra vulgaris]XP_047138476.1 DNA ligase 3 isoform X1 [Hydra vulgaris]
MAVDSFYSFCELCKTLADEPSYNNKTAIIKKFIISKSSKGKYDGDLVLFAKLLLPGVEKRIYNLKDKQLLKHTSQIFEADLEEMKLHLEGQGVVSNTIQEFFNKSCSTVIPLKRSILSLQEVDGYLEELSNVTKEEAQIKVLTKICKRCTAENLCFIIKLIKHDLRMNTGPKHFFDALDSSAYALFQASSDLKSVIEKWTQLNSEEKLSSGTKNLLSIETSVMTPIKPMLADACKSIEQAIKKCPNGMYSEIKYDGERVQVHKNGNKFEYYSRSLKSVQPHKIADITHYLPQACPGGDTLILDGEVLLMDTNTNKPLPFGTLSIHKKSKFAEATVCYVIFDILQFNSESLLKRPLCERREILCKNVKEIKGRIVFSEMKEITKSDELQCQLKKVFSENLEGLVIKDIKSIYEPGKRHWLKIKKDYLQDGAMADTADLVVLGAYYGTGNKGGMMSVFLMGCYDPDQKKWLTVAKCGNGFDDDTIKKLQSSLQMKKISKDPDNVPSWLKVNRSLIPDFVAVDPKTSPVWEITGAEFSQSTTHTAAGISIRFPRVTKVRSDKNWKSATNLSQLQKLYNESKKTTDVDLAGQSSFIQSETLVSVESVSSSLTNPPSKESESSRKRKTPSESNKNMLSKKKTPSNEEATVESEKPVCQYGSNCYRKNKEHFKEFSHGCSSHGSSKTKVEEPSTTNNNKKNLENIFTGLTFVIAENVKESKKLRRFIVAYDGDIAEEHETNSADYIVSEEKIEDSGLHAVVVKPEWIWTCIKKKRIADHGSF